MARKSKKGAGMGFVYNPSTNHDDHNLEGPCPSCGHHLEAHELVGNHLECWLCRCTIAAEGAHKVAKKSSGLCRFCDHPVSRHTFRGTTECMGCTCMGPEVGFTKGKPPSWAKIPPPAPPTPPDPALVAAMFLATTDVRGDVPEGGLSTLSKKRTLIPTKEGLRLVTKTSLFVAVTPAENITPLVLPLGIERRVPKVPWALFRQTIGFFRAVAGSMNNSEALVQFFYNPNAAPGADPWIAHVPSQQVSGGRVEATNTIDPEGKLLHVMDIHSHNTMGAFWSSTDDTDELRAERFYGVVGKVTDITPEWLFRVNINGTFHPLTLHEVIETPTQAVNVETTVAQLLGMERKGGVAKLDVTLYDLFTPPEFPQAWLEAVRHAGAGKGLYQDAQRNGQAAEMQQLVAHLEAQDAQYGLSPVTREKWAPAGDPYPAMYAKGNRVVYAYGQGGTLNRLLGDAAWDDPNQAQGRVLTALNMWIINNDVIPKMGEENVRVWSHTGNLLTPGVH